MFCVAILPRWCVSDYRGDDRVSVGGGVEQTQETPLQAATEGDLMTAAWCRPGAIVLTLFLIL